MVDLYKNRKQKLYSFNKETAGHGKRFFCKKTSGRVYTSTRAKKIGGSKNQHAKKIGTRCKEDCKDEWDPYRRKEFQCFSPTQKYFERKRPGHMQIFFAYAPVRHILGGL